MCEVLYAVAAFNQLSGLPHHDGPPVELQDPGVGCTWNRMLRGKPPRTLQQLQLQLKPVPMPDVA